MLIWKELSSGADDTVAQNEIRGSGISESPLAPVALTLNLFTQIINGAQIHELTTHQVLEWMSNMKISVIGRYAPRVELANWVWSFGYDMLTIYLRDSSRTHVNTSKSN